MSVFSTMPHRLPVGLKGLDRLLGGGLSPHSACLVAGCLGTGKTTCGLEFLLAGVPRGECGLYISCAADYTTMVFPGPALGARFTQGLGRQLFYFHFPATAPAAVAAQLQTELAALCRRHRMVRVVIDGVHCGDRDDFRLLSTLLDICKKNSTTCLLPYGLPLQSAGLDHYGEKLAAYCDTVLLLTAPSGPVPGQRHIRILKNRGGSVPDPVLPYTLTRQGLRLQRPPSRRIKAAGLSREEMLIFVPYSLSMEQWRRYFEQLIGRYVRKHPGARLTVVSNRAHLLEQLLAAPDHNYVLALVPLNNIPGLVRRNRLAALDQLLPEAVWRRFLPRALDSCRYRGQMYAVPRFLDAKAVLFRRDLLKKHGFSPPASWDELAAQAAAILAREADPDLEGLILPAPLLQGNLSDLFLEYVWSRGGDIFNAKGTVSFDSPACMQGLRFLRDLVHRQRIVRPEMFPVIFQNRIAKFLAGGAVFLYLSCETLYWAARTDPRRLQQIGYCFPGRSTPPPVPSGLLLGAGIGIPRQTRHPATARELLRLSADQIVNFKIHHALGFNEGLNSYARHSPSAGIPETSEFLARGRFYTEIDPFFEAAPALTRELVSVISRDRDLQRAQHRLYERLWLYRPHGHHDEWVRRAMLFIENHLEQPLTLQDIARQVNVSLRHLNRIFKLKTGHSCIDYHISLRMERAQALLSTTTQAISEIARASGYADQNYFSGQFKQRIGVSPRRYRAQYPT